VLWRNCVVIQTRFFFAFGEATITLEDDIVLGGYPIIGDPVFTEVKDQEMRVV